MVGPPSERKGIPGGLRAQLLVGLCLLIVVAFVLAAVVAEHAIQRQLPIASTRQLLVVYLGLDAFFILLVGYAFLTYVVMRPLRAIGVATERAARGDLASPITVLPSNEFGRLGRQFNQMLDELRKNREALEERLEELDFANKQLRETQDSLIRSEKLASVGQLAAGVAHEVGNPLAALSGYLELLEDGDLGDEMTADILTRSQNEVERMRAIIRDLLDYSREQAEPAVEAVSLARCVEEARNLVKAQPKARNVAIEAELPDDLPAVTAVASQVVQVLVNLLINAIDAIDPDRGRIAISARTDDEAGQVVLALEDNGPGISAEKLQRVFDPFFTTKDPGEGTGLGLAICLRIMRRVDGDIRVENAEGAGARFELVFQIRPSVADN